MFAGLIAKADVLIDNFRLGTLEKWGFGDAWFERHAPRVVRCSITGYGSSGRKAALPGYDFILQAESGLMSICGEPDGKPAKYGVAIVDVCTGMLASNSILAALHARERTGKGQKVELSLYETSLAMLVNVAASYLAAGRNAPRFGNGHPSIVPYTTYQAADGMIALGIGNERPFARIAEVLGHPEWASDARFTSNRARVENRALVDRMINEALSHDDADVWLTKLKAVGIPCGKINSGAKALDDPQTAARGMIVAIEHCSVVALKMLGIPFKFSDTACSVRRPPPTLGDPKSDILAGELGLDDKTFAELRQP